jgi:phage terminase large subunit
MASLSSPVIRLPYKFDPWPYQEEIFLAFYQQGIRRFCEVWPRRHGKDKTFLNLCIDQMMQRVGNYCHVFPQRNRARRIVWQGIDNDGMRYTDHFPAPLVYRKSEVEMTISLVHPDDVRKEGSIYWCLGSDIDANLLVGTNPMGVIWSEFAEINPRMRELVLPILRQNNGWEAIVMTPRGRNHAYRLFHQVRTNPEWHVTYMTRDKAHKHDGTQVVSDADVAADIAAGMDPRTAKQEYDLAWDAPMPGAFYGEEFDLIEAEGRIRSVPYDPRLPVYTAWDLGHNDVNAIWWLQPAGREIRCIDYEEGSSIALVADCETMAERAQKSWARVVRGKPYVYDHSRLSPPLTTDPYEVHYAPHDIEVHEYSTGKTRWGIALAGETFVTGEVYTPGIRFTVIPRGTLEDGIAATRKLLARAVFDVDKCAHGIDALRSYRREKDEKRETFVNTPYHDWCLTGDTSVLTRSGMYRIMDLPITGEVLTSCGWKLYQHPRITRRNAPLVEVVFNDGFTVRCTREHLFKTASGWKSAASLTPGLPIQSALTPSPSILMEVSTAFGQISRILQKGALSCIATSGSLPLAISLQPVTSITGMARPFIMPWVIWNVFLKRSISLKNGIVPDVIPRQESISAHWQKRKRQNGMRPLLDDSGIVAMPSGVKVGPSGGERKSLVSFVGRLCRRLFAKTGLRRNIVPIIAKPLIIVDVKPLAVCADVWCLTVPGLAEFALANGALVHNSSNGSDAFRYAAVGLTAALQAPPPAPPPGSFASIAREYDRWRRTGRTMRSYVAGGR